MTDLPEDIQIKSLLRQHAEYYDAPQSLRDAILQQATPRLSGYRALLSWLSAPMPRVAASFSMGALAALLVAGPWMAAQQEKQSMLLALASDHARAIVTQNTIEVRSSSMHTVKPWLSSQLGYSPQIVDMNEQGFPLVGGRRGFIGGVPVAVAVYAYRQHEIDVYVLTSAMYRQFPQHLEAVNGYNSATWGSGDLHYIAISDMGQTQLKSFSRLLADSQASSKQD